MSALTHLAKHTIDQVLKPDTDREAWMAYQVLKVKYSTITYCSHNGYHCDGLVDYKRGLQFTNSEFLDTKTKEVLSTTGKPFYEMNTDEIVNAWMRVVGETETTKQNWLTKIWRSLW